MHTGLSILVDDIGKLNVPMQIVLDERMDEFEADVSLHDRIEVRREPRPYILHRHANLAAVPDETDFNGVMAV